MTSKFTCKPGPGRTHRINQMRSLSGPRTNGFASNEAGVTSVFFGLFLVAILFVSAVALDYSRMVTERTRDQRALDAAVLAASNQLGMDNAAVDGETMAKAFYAANRTQNPNSKIKDVKLNSDEGEISAATSTDWKATLLKAVEKYFPGVSDDRNISVKAKVRRGNGTTEIALVLDNSGSMSGTYISDLKTAAKDLLQNVFAGVEGSDRVKVGVVPFAASVNVGSMYSGANWIDGTGSSPVHYENVSENRTRFQLFGDLGVGWGGCVEARPNGHDVTDVPASGADKLFVPMFAPDEPGDAGSALSGYTNSYIDDDGGSCTPYPRECLKYSRRGKCKKERVIRLPEAQAQARTCKYRNQPFIDGTGPNFMCTTKAILPLNSTKTTIETAIDAMQARGNTNIKEGVAWGWRVLSPSLPFAEGRSNGTSDNSKMLVLMTDGENWYQNQNTHNKSIYAAHGYASKGRLGTTYSRAAYTTYVNERTRQVCANAKADGIKVFTVAFRLESDPVTSALLKDCASSDDDAYVASNGSMLIQSFRNIGKQISEIRISE
ncbi:MAG: VWA domain-containing protein [Alphaproteobacteria bacterium]|nr:VWA domain-containing protein [Alphaproteobacteria bacterium]